MPAATRPLGANQLTEVMATLVEQLYSQNHWAAIDGAQTIWNFSFSGGYILPAHVKAYYLDSDGARVDVTVTEDMLIGEFQLQVVPPVPASATRFVIYRDTPKDLPLVSFEDGALVAEPNLDRIAMQAVFVAAEVLDGASVSSVGLASILQRLAALEAAGTGDTSQFGFKSLKKNSYVGNSTVLSADNGKAHFKMDATPVVVPNSLPVEFLCTVVNFSNATMIVSFQDCVAAEQGNSEPQSAWVVPVFATVTLWKVLDGVWILSGPRDSGGGGGT